MNPTPTNKPIEPLPCPFCGSSAHFTKHEDGWDNLECSNIECGIKTQGWNGKSLAIEAWNKRTPLTQSHAEEKIVKIAQVDMTKVCPTCMGEGKLWCAMCGKYGDHRSGGCPELKKDGLLKAADEARERVSTYSNDKRKELENHARSNMKILTSGTTVSEGDKFTHVEWEVYERLLDSIETLKISSGIPAYRKLQAQNERMAKALQCIVRSTGTSSPYNKIAREALSSPPSESIKEGERELTDKELLDSGMIRFTHHADEWGHTTTLHKGCDLRSAIKSAMKSEAERK